MDKAEEILIRQLKDGVELAYKSLYDQHYAVLCHVAATYVKDDFLAETIVGDVIFHLWERREQLDISSSLRSYLVQSVRHRCLDYLKSQYHQREVTSLQESALPVYAHSDEYPLGQLLEKELETTVAEAIEHLPEDCRRVFKLSRFEGKKNAEIAERLGISVNTVKYHIKRALAILHESLRDYMIILLTIILHIIK